MAGTIRGKVLAIETGMVNEQQCASFVFKNFFDFMEAHPTTTRIALQYGTGGSGTDFFDGANPFQRGSFAVWRFNPAGARTWPFYVMAYCNSGVTTGESTSNWLLEGLNVSSTVGLVGISAAVGIGGDENPWNGSTVNDGTDAIGSPRWAVPAGGTDLIVVPASNRTGAPDGTNKQNTLAMFYQTSGMSEAAGHFFADDDGVMWVTDDDNNLYDAETRYGYVGIYEPFAHLTVARPFCGIRKSSTETDVDIGLDRGGVTAPDGVAYAPILTTKTNYYTNAGFQPDEQAGNLFVPQRIVLASDESVGNRGTFGSIPALMQEVSDIQVWTTNAARDRIALGSATKATLKMWVPWTGTNVHPVIGRSRNGISFP